MTVVTPRRLYEVVTGDMSLREKYNTESGYEKEETRLKSQKKNRSQKKALYTIFLNSSGIMLRWPLEKKKSVTGKYYREFVLAKLSRFYRRIRPNTGTRGSTHFHDNTPAHKCMLVLKYLADNNIETLPHPPYFPDLASSDFCFMFPELNECPAGRRSNSRSVLGGSAQCLTHRPKIDFRRAFLQWVERLRVCHVQLSSIRGIGLSLPESGVCLRGLLFWYDTDYIYVCVRTLRT